MSEAKSTGGHGDLDPEQDAELKIILLGDSAVGKSKLIERYLMNEYNPRQLSTYALTLFRKDIQLEGEDKKISVDFWDTAGQERFRTLTTGFYKKADGIVICFDVTT